MMRESNKRPRRNPLTSEEVLQIIAHKKKLELVTLRKLKQSRFFKLANSFNIICIFIYLELLLCYFGPCHYQKHQAIKTVIHYGNAEAVDGKLFIADLDLFTAENKKYKIVIEEAINTPPQQIPFIIGKDFLLQKELKAVLRNSGKTYRLFAASPVLFLCLLASFISFFGFIMNLNENSYTLSGLTILNALALFAISLI